MAKPKNTYTFSSTKEDADLRRIVDENPESRVIVCSRKNSECPTITIVREGRDVLRVQEAGHRAVGVNFNPPFYVFAGDIHGIALGLVETKVEAY